jgi:adenylate cyclase
MSQQRRLAAILFTDIVDSTAIMQKDEQMALSINKRFVFVLKQSVSNHGGEILNDYGDGCLCAFTSATQAVRCAIDIQQQLQSEPKVPLRIGLHVGEMIFEDGKVLGDGVNVASRIQSIGASNSILFSSEIYNKLVNQPEFKCKSIGKFQFKNVNMPVEVFALCNEGFIVPDKKKIEGKLQEKKTYWSRIILTTIILLLGIISFFFYRHYFGRPAFTGKEKSIAVLPFEAISSEKENQYINDGFTIDIIDKLSKLSGLTEVPGWARVKLYKNFKGNIIDIANELGVAAILTGTIQKQGDKIQIIADLTDVNTGKTIWHTDDERSWGDVLTLQNEVAEKIAGSLSAHLTAADQIGIKRQYTDNVEAYNFYIRGRYFWDSRTTESFDSAEANYKKAIELDPNYGLAYAGLADLYIFNQKGLTQLQAIPIARDYASKALALDSTLVAAITTVGFIQYAYDYDWVKSKSTLEKAIKMDPGYGYAHIFYGNLLLHAGQNTQGGIDEIKKALDLDPSSVSANYILGRNYYLAGEYDLAEQQLRKTINMNSRNPIVKAYLAYVLLAKKDFENAIDIIKQIPQNGEMTNAIYGDVLLAYANGLLGKTKQANEELNKILKGGSFTAHYNLAYAYMALGENKLALDELDKAVTGKEIFLIFVKIEPIFFPLKNEPRFKELLKKMNLE